MGANRLEKYEIKKVHRRSIEAAPYNPRKMTKDAEKKLRKSLRDFGIMTPIIVNMQTGRIVGGHQRLNAMDSIMRKDDYELSVAMVDLSPDDEVRANIILNNPAIQGTYDEDMLAEIHIDFPEIDFEKDLGFEKYDMDVMFADMDDGSLSAFEPEEQEEVRDSIEEMRNIDSIKKAKKAHRDKVKEENAEGGTHNIENDDYIVSFVFPNNSEKHDFMRRIKEKPGEKFIRHTKLFDIQDGKYKAYGKEMEE